MKPSLSRRSMLRFGATAFCLGQPALAAMAGSAYPTRPVRLIVPFATGGAMDVLARAFASPLGRSLGQQTVVENKPGGGSLIGTSEVARSRPDGYTLLMGSIDGIVLQPLLRKSPPYDPARDLSLVAGVANTPVTITASKASGFRNIDDLVSAAKKRPGAVQFGSPGVGSVLHLAGELFARSYGISLSHVAYRGGGPAVLDLLGNHIPLLVSVPADVADRHKNGDLVVLAQCGKTRHDSLPDVPTLTELGHREMEVYAWFALVAPAKTPDAVLAQLGSATASSLQDTALRDSLAHFGFDPMPMDRARLEAFASAERTRWADVIRGANLELAD